MATVLFFTGSRKTYSSSTIHRQISVERGGKKQEARKEKLPLTTYLRIIRHSVRKYKHHFGMHVEIKTVLTFPDKDGYIV